MISVIDKPLNDYVLIDTDFKQEQTEFGIFLPDAMRAESKEGTILSISPDLKTNLKIGDRVLFNSKSAIKTSQEPNESKVLCVYFQLMMNLDTRIPYSDYILLKPMKAPEKTEVGIFLTEEMRSMSGFGEIISCSVDLPKSLFIPKAGDFVMHRKEIERETDLEDLGNEYLLKYKNLMALLKNT